MKTIGTRRSVTVAALALLLLVVALPPLGEFVLLRRIAAELRERHAGGYTVLIYHTDGEATVTFNPYRKVWRLFRERHGRRAAYYSEKGLANPNHIAIVVSDDRFLYG